MASWGIDRGVFYLDASALMKLAVTEPESAALRDALSPRPRRVSSRVAAVEVIRAARLRGPGGEMGARRVVRGLWLLRVSDRVLARAIALQPARLRTLDAIHVASALAVGRALSGFVSYDRRQLSAAQTVGLPTLSPV